MATRSHSAFTLFEVALSLVLITIGVVSVMMLLPVGIKAQQMARYRLYAGAKMLEIADLAANPDHAFARWEGEAEKLGQSSFTGDHSHLDHLLSSTWFGTVPLPDEIARRLDSDDDEIANLLGAGGHLYYASPIPMSSNFCDNWTQADLTQAPEAQKVVIGIIGFPQQSALTAHPCIGWPYTDWFPSPPVHSGDGTADYDAKVWQVNAVSNGGTWPGLAEFQAVTNSSNGVWTLYNGQNVDDATAATSARTYRATCAKLLEATGAAATATATGPIPALPKDLTTLAPPWAATDLDAFPLPYRVLAMRYLANAAMWCTSPRFLPSADEQDYAKQVFASALAWGHRYARANPYDWGCLRMSQELVFSDYPLMQFDLFGPSVSVDDGFGNLDRSWKVLAPLTPTNVGAARGWYPGGTPIPDNHAQITSSWGDQSRFTLTDRFEARERCRQVVFWAGDWQSYKDFEEVPSTLFDAKDAYINSRGDWVSSSAFKNNPEQFLLWQDATRSKRMVCKQGDMNTSDDPALFVGNYGADRNGNGVLDHGPMPTSARLRALTVARFNFYDKRVVASSRY